MQYDILTIFPEIFDSYINESIIKIAQEKNKIQINTHDIRENSKDKHNKVDDKPYGGGVGMVMKIGPIYRTLEKIKRKKNSHVILFTPKGKKWNQQMAQKYAKDYSQVIMICGRYEGIDDRIKNFIDEEVSIGDYVLTGGELGALVLIDSISRLIPGVLGKDESSKEDSHSKPGYLEYPHYTRPEEFKSEGKVYKVPKILLSGNHAEIEKWREKHSKKK